jgi:lambda family phage portal protein
MTTKKATKARRPGSKALATVTVPTAAIDNSATLQALAQWGPGPHLGASNLRNVRDWNPGLGSADADLLGDHGDLVSRSRDLDRNNGIARGALQTHVDNIVGTGLRLTPRPNYRALGWEKEQADEWSEGVYSQFIGWADTTACDATDFDTFDGLCQQAQRSGLSGGEVLSVPLWITDRSDDWGTKLLMIEADRLSNPGTVLDSADVRAGIKFDGVGRAIGYYIRNTHPGDWYTRQVLDPDQWAFVPRRGVRNRLRVLHCFDRERPGQSRGKPLMTPIMREFKQADRYVGAELDAAVVNAMVAGIITTPMDQETIEGLFQTETSREWYLNARKSHALAGLSAGSLIPLMPGDDIKPFAPARPATAFAAFIENILRIMGVGMDLPYELLLKDFSKTNYSSARASMLEAWRSFNRRRDSLGTKWGDPIYMLWLEEAVNAGKIEAPDFYQNRAAYGRCRWIGPGRGWVDEVKEITAAKLRIDSGISTYEDECARQGVDWREVAEQRKTEQDFFKQLGIDPADAVVPGTPADPKALQKQVAELQASFVTEPEQQLVATA